MKRIVDGFERAGAVLLFVMGMAMVILAVLDENAPEVATVLVVFGAALMSVAALLPRLVGQFRVGIHGFDGQLIAAVKQEAAVKGLTPAQTDQAIQAAQSESDAWSAWLNDIVVRARRPDSTALDGFDRSPILQLARRYVEEAGGASITDD